MSGPSREAQAVPQPLSCRGDCEQAESAPRLRFVSLCNLRSPVRAPAECLLCRERGDPVPPKFIVRDPKFDCGHAPRTFQASTVLQKQA